MYGAMLAFPVVLNGKVIYNMLLCKGLMHMKVNPKIYETVLILSWTFINWVGIKDFRRTLPHPHIHTQYLHNNMLNSSGK